MQLVGDLRQKSNDYSIVNKKYLEYFNRDYVRCAVADIAQAADDTSYRIDHNLGTSNIVLGAYSTTNSFASSVDIGYNVLDASSVVVHFDSLGSAKPAVRIVIMGAMTYSTATVTQIVNPD